MKISQVRTLSVDRIGQRLGRVDRFYRFYRFYRFCGFYWFYWFGHAAAVL